MPPGDANGSGGGLMGNICEALRDVELDETGGCELEAGFGEDAAPALVEF